MTDIAVRKLTDKPGKYIVVEENEHFILRNLSGISGQTREIADEIAIRLREEKKMKEKREKRRRNNI